MSTPTKKRRKNDYEPPTQPIKSLDFFFGKRQAKEQDKAKQPETVNGNADEDTKHKVPEEELTDEQLARKLQAEWDEQDRAERSGQANNTTISAGDLQSDAEKEPPDKSADDGDAIKPEPGVPATKPANNAFSALGKKQTLSLQSATAEDDTTSYAIPFDQSPLTFDPQKYVPDLEKHTQSRIKIVDTLVNLLRTLIEGDPGSLLPAVWLATNAISPPYIDIELGLGGSAISKALKKVCGLDNAALKTLYNKHGDAGDVAFEAKKRQSLTLRKPKPLTIRGVYESLHKIASAKGQGSQEAKQRIVERLVQDARGAEESRYIVRTLVQHLRIGAVKTTMLIALSRAFVLSRPSNADFETKDVTKLAKLSKQDLAAVYSQAEETVKACFARRPNYNDIVPALLEIGVCDELLVRCGLALHIPLRPMLGSITRDLGEMLTKLQGRDFSCEFKYDGQRAQVHCDEKGKVTVFSRHLEVMTEKYPDLVALVPKIRGEGVSSFIMEGEVVAIDRESGELKPFQILANRARKDVVIQSVKVDVCLYAFDLMYLNGEELLDRPFRERRSLLRSLFVEIPNHFTWVMSLDATSANVETVSNFYKQATDIKCEGIMVKVLDNAPNPDLMAEMDVDPTDEPAPPTPAKAVSKPANKSTKKKDKVTAHTRGRAEITAEDLTTDPNVKTRRKALLATYEPDKRLDSWLKVKKDYNSTMDTIDLIPVGGWHGQGRKNAWWSPILLACRNEENGTLEVVTKCISGFSDAFYKANKEKYSEDGPNTISRPSYVEYGGEPEVWFEPQEVWEMAFADITLSPTYTAAIGLVSEERGLSMRFPRFLKVREDKSIEEASTNEFLAGLYRKQEVKAPVADKGEPEEELYE
ncbi:ATP-dependent DNA ligase [Teratosphaeria nubilosa]|uniref:DNA ligase n=1 Tax=Teratosphaeria nubilosa TaxID=161662 RepID=A0A6G1L6M4_9PEZI|nr:ATP-dependent DNA ligase [Teratosphaeria nubilosa]